MSNQGLKPEQGQIYAQTIQYARQLNLAKLRQLSQAIDYLIIKKKRST